MYSIIVHYFTCDHITRVNTAQTKIQLLGPILHVRFRQPVLSHRRSVCGSKRFVENLSQVNLEICVGVQKLFCCPSKRLDKRLFVFCCYCWFFPEKVIAGTDFFSFLFGES